MLYMNCGAYEQALPIQSAAVEKSSTNTIYLVTLAVIHQTLGNLKTTAKIYRDVLNLDSKHQGALSGLARLETASSDTNIVELLRTQLVESGNFPIDREIRLRYALAKQLEDIEEYDGSFQELSKAASLKRANIKYNVGDDQKLVNQMIGLFPNNSDMANNLPNSDAPIFVVGMPRSGTTLVERIITSHPQVASAGELHDFGLSALDICGRPNQGNYLDADFAELINSSDMAAIGMRYLERTMRYQQDRPKFVDKLPMNALYAGFIRRALPNAKIVELQRHPVDVCFSNFKILFRSGYGYSYDLEELADFYIAYRKLMDHWSTVLGVNYITISYEALVNNQEQESRRLIKKLGLDWHDDCLRFYDNKQATATASSAQVRKPIYKKAVGRWKCYEKELAIVIHRLKTAGISV